MNAENARANNEPSPELKAEFQPYLEKAAKAEHQQQWLEAAQNYEQLLELLKEERVAKQLPDEQLQLTFAGWAYVSYLAQEKHDKKKRLWKHISKLAPGISRLALLEKYLREGHTQIVEKLCHETLEKEKGKQLEVYNHLGKAYEWQNKWEKAAEIHEKVERLSQEWAASACARAYACYLVAENFPKSHHHWQKMQNKYHMDRLFLANRCAEEGHKKFVISILDQVQLEEPEKQQEVYNCLVKLYKKRGEAQQLQQIVQKARHENKQITQCLLSSEIIASYLHQAKWGHCILREKQPTVITGWQGKHGPRELVFTINELQQTLGCTVRQYLEIKPENREALQEAVRQINEQTKLTQLVVDNGSPYVHFFAGILFGETVLEQETFGHCLQEFVGVDLHYYPLLVRVNEEGNGEELW